MLRYQTAGESHGKGLLALVDGFPSGVTIDQEHIDSELRRRQGGYGRGGRQAIETDHADILSGIWRGKSMGSPIALLVPNKDYKIEKMDDLDRPRPGHGDLTGGVKYLAPVRHILERASARETAAKVAAGALAAGLLREFDIRPIGYVVGVGPLEIPPTEGTFDELLKRRDESCVYSLDPSKDQEARDLIDQAQEEGDTLGGLIEVRVDGLPFGLGTHAQWDLKLDGKLAQAVMAMQAIKGVEIGDGFDLARRKGSEAHDAIQYDASQADARTLGYVRPTNRAGGIEAGMTNGQPLILRAAMKPIATLRTPMESINFKTKKKEEAAYERSDVCAISAASVVVENLVAFELAAAMVDKFGGDSLQEMKARWDLFHQMAKER